MRFQFFPLRFQFVAKDALYFPPGKAGNMLRGALGSTLKRISGESGAYARIFEPVAASTTPSPSGLVDPPRPFVFRARHLDGRTIQRHEPFHFDVHIFSLDPEVLTCFLRSFAELAREGLGGDRGKAELRSVVRIALGDLSEGIVYRDATLLPVEPATLDLTSATSAPHTIRVDFLSPTELKRNHGIASRPEFPILFGRIRDRIATLSALYGDGPLAIDFRAIGDRAALVRMSQCELQSQDVERRSTRTGQTHSIGGFTGFAEYEGEIAEFLPYLEAACWVGVGRQVVWGKGEIAITAAP